VSGIGMVCMLQYAHQFLIRSISLFHDNRGYLLRQRSSPFKGTGVSGRNSTKYARALKVPHCTSVRYTVFFDLLIIAYYYHLFFGAFITFFYNSYFFLYTYIFIELIFIVISHLFFVEFVSDGFYLCLR
jgi:cellulose synthase/poly-beta-1,6-N-acetylglucosamine synthase-like glycosyltransferase